MEVAPLLCIIDDFLTPLDAFFLVSEHGTNPSAATSPATKDYVLQKKGGVAETGVGGGGPCTNESVKGNDKEAEEEGYLSGLEMYCLLKCRLLNMKHQWKLVLDQAMPEKGKGTFIRG